MINRTDKNQNNFTQVDNNLIKDNTISCGAKGILLYLLSKPDDWQFYEADIEKHFTDNIKVIRRYIKELMVKGHIHRDKIRNTDGRFTYNYNIYEIPRLSNIYTIMPYKEYLETDHWKETRSKALKKANYKCELCNGSKDKLNVHHKTYERKGNELPEDLIVLCENCHGKFHDKIKQDII